SHSISSSKHDSIPATLWAFRKPTICRTVWLLRSSLSDGAEASVCSFAATMAARIPSLNGVPPQYQPHLRGASRRYPYADVSAAPSQDPHVRQTVAFVAGGTALFALTHSLLATQWMKDRVEAALGSRARDGLYRFAYNNITYASLGAMLLA